MDGNQPQPGQVSSDGRWVWSGTQWVARQEATTPAAQGAAAQGTDATSGWQWDGQRWVPSAGGAAGAIPVAASTPKAAGRIKPWMLIAIVAGLVIAALGVVYLLFFSSSNEVAAPLPSPTVTQSADMLPTESPSESLLPTETASGSEVPFPTDTAVPTGEPFPTAASPTASGAQTVDQARAAVNWTRFAAGTQEKVDVAAAAANCPELQALRATAVANDAAVQQNTGTGTADLVAYIDAQLRATGCQTP